MKSQKSSKDNLSNRQSSGGRHESYNDDATRMYNPKSARNAGGTVRRNSSSTQRNSSNGARSGNGRAMPKDGRLSRKSGQDGRYNQKYDDNELNKKSKKEKKPMSEGRRKFIKVFNRIFLIAYIIFSIFVVYRYFTWKNLVTPMLANKSSIVVDSNGDVLATLGEDKKQNNIEISQVPDNLKNAYIDIEDERFYKHSGVDIKRTAAAILTYVTHGGKSSFGGSTITQQLVKNLTGNDDNSISRKASEWVRAAELESFTSKDEILQAYFNIIYLAPNVYGVDMGAKYYFNKSVGDLDLAECAFLAGINNSPNSYNPFGEKDNSEKIKTRTKAVLDKMLKLKHISNDEYNNAISEVEAGLKFSNGDIQADGDGVYSYHTDALISEVISDVSSKKHIDSTFAKNYIYSAGLTIYSTEDKSVQENLDSVYGNEKYVITSSTTGEKSQSAMVIIDHSTGYVVGCEGALGEKTTSRGFNRATQALRQTGSAIKPIAVLAPGIDKKLFTASTIYNDEETTFDDPNTEEGYSPTDNDDYIGEITVRRAVESSQNIPFVKMMEQVTPKVSIKYLEKMGISSLTDNDQNLALALGGLDKGITPLEMAAAYATIANDGKYIEPTFYTKVNSSNGKTVMKSKQKTKKVFSKEVAYILKSLLKQPVEGDNGTAQGCKIDGFDVAAKTGTTNDNYDKWLCGFTTYYTAVTWYGYDMNETISFKGKSPAAQLWSSVMNKVHSNLSGTSFEKPSGIKSADICAKTGLLATDKCSDTYTEYYLSGTIPTSKCTACTGSSSGSGKSHTETTSKPTATTETTSTPKNEVVETTPEPTKTPTPTATATPNTKSQTTPTPTATLTPKTQNQTKTTPTPTPKATTKPNNKTQNTTNNEGGLEEGEEDNGP